MFSAKGCISSLLGTKKQPWDVSGAVLTKLKVNKRRKGGKQQEWRAKNKSNIGWRRTTKKRACLTVACCSSSGEVLCSVVSPYCFGLLMLHCLTNISFLGNSGSHFSLQVWVSWWQLQSAYMMLILSRCPLKAMYTVWLSFRWKEGWQKF